MIIGHKQNATESVLASVQSSPCQFHLTGSRFFNTATALSDWDFFTTDDKMVRSSLVLWGFKIHSMPQRGAIRKTAIVDKQDYSYIDTNCITVYRHHEAKIDIQIVKDVNLKVDAQNMLLPLYPFIIKDIPKHGRWKLWHAAYTAVKAIR